MTKYYGTENLLTKQCKYVIEINHLTSDIYISIYTHRYLRVCLLNSLLTGEESVKIMIYTKEKKNKRKRNQ